MSKPILEVISIHAPEPQLARCEICGHKPRASKFEDGKHVIRCSWCTRERKGESLAALCDSWNGRSTRLTAGKPAARK